MSLKDHLRSLADKEPPSPDEPAAEEAVPAASPSPSASPVPAGLGAVEESLVSITADDREGKGFLIDGEGKILTSFHLVFLASRIKVTTRSGDIFLGRLVRQNESRDLALIQISSKTPQHLTLGDSSAVDVGEDVFILGGPTAASKNLEKVVVSALRVIDGTALIQVDRSIDPANTGSPFVTQQGEVVGVASYKMGTEGENLGFAISVKELKAFISGQTPASS